MRSPLKETEESKPATKQHRESVLRRAVMSVLDTYEFIYKEFDGAPTVDRDETGAKASQGSSHYDSKKERFTEDGDSQSETSYEFIYEQFDGAPTIDQVEMVEKTSPRFKGRSSK
ncbi:hypothetical protein THAOC_16672 [Thalassiosira oceanica]|uniref:Uncharacterized protein n=1 Tax=Thalassiosira oceanica TaxID=159749 RepID=K0S9C8_THAOC|nr:hypothetical protein THAOC_16672 [Thalassiosira oceanica]|eukprot:EJK62703.1 hypothetical protein THAOC_16672 [Thalassiosira oceanica]